MVWAGVDVGGRRKGFHAAIVDVDGVQELTSLTTAQGITNWLSERTPRLVAVDCPATPAPDGDSARAGELALMRAGICNIRFTPDRRRLSGNPSYYEWIDHGLELYAALERAGLAAIECFPTASWTRWAGPRGGARRATWTQAAIERLALARMPPRLNQDQRDAIAAALTARAHELGQTERFGDIIVPRAEAGGGPGTSPPQLLSTLNSAFPSGLESLPGDMAELVVQLARFWAAEPSRPRPAPAALTHWAALIDAWSDDFSLPLYVRRSDNNRGSVISHSSGRQIVPTDNSPALWVFAQAVLGEQPSLGRIRRLVADDQVPVAMVLNATEKSKAYYRCTLGKVVSPNAYGWKVAHVDPVGLMSRTSIADVAEPILRSHFRKLMSPRNMFAIPLRYAGLGELPEFCDAIRAMLPPD